MKLRTVAPLGLLLLATTASADTAVYDLDAMNAKEIAEALGRVLEAQCAVVPNTALNVNPHMCKVELLPTGQVLVAAPAATQTQVAAVIKAIAARNATPTPRVTLQYWVIYGVPGKPTAADDSLKPLASVIQQLERAHGELAFSLEDTARITAQSGTGASAAGGLLQINENVRVSGDSLDLAAQISFTAPPHLTQGLHVNVTIKRGEFLVLAERTTGEAEKPGMMFYVVHWPQDQ